MNDQYLISSNVKVVSGSPPVKLWTPSTVGILSLFLGIPGGMGMASINWIRMGLINKAVAHLVGGAVCSTLFIIFAGLLPESWGPLLVFTLNISALIYLYNSTAKDIYIFKATNHEVQNAHWLMGVLISIIMLGLYLAQAFIVSLVLVIISALLGLPTLQ